MRGFPARRAGLAILVLLTTAAPARAAEALHGADLPWPLALPFAGILLSIALGPLFVKEWWHIHYEKAAAFWALLSLAGLVATAGAHASAAAFVHMMALEYMPFILMLFALFTAAGGIVISGKLTGGPLVNSAILGLGTVLASVIGTTGASMVLLRPLIRANASRRFNAHVVVFFIFLVSNIGGALTPLGDPPLFLGFLEGVHFFWTTQNLWPATLFSAATLLALFFLIDSYALRREPSLRGAAARSPKPGPRLRVTGLANFVLIAFAIAAIVASGVWRPDLGFEFLGTKFELQNGVRESVMIIVGLASLALTSKAEREANGFEWEPIREVAYLFAGIFICIIPVMAMLQAGSDGPFAPAIHFLSRTDGTPNNPVYFWMTGLLSSFLDNAPTYLVFFHLAGGDPETLMGPLAATLAAISLGAVFMGANTYIGNAPNFMVYAIARRSGIRMPGFFPYMLWSSAILLPLFAAVTFLFIPNPPLKPQPVAAAQGAPEADTTAPPPVSAISPAAEAELARQTFEDLRRQLRILQDDAARAEARNHELEGKIADLEARLREAPPQTAAGLARVRADFFDRLAQNLGERPDLVVEDDHFVLPAQTLFGKAPARLDAGGRAVLDVVARTILALERAMPKDFDWIVRVDGHADKTPIVSQKFESNSALAFERANAVVQYLITRGVPPQRLVAASFGEFQPRRRPAGALPQDSAKAASDNRRIELTIADR